MDLSRLGMRDISLGGMDYLVSGVENGSREVDGEVVPARYVTYYRVRNGEPVSASFLARADDEPGSEGRMIWDAIRRASQ